MNLPTLALVTSMCKGLTLYTHLHLRKDKFSMNKTVIIAQQISQVSWSSVKFLLSLQLRGLFIDVSVITTYNLRVWATFMHEESSIRT
jgi:hypothetical protein